MDPSKLLTDDDLAKLCQVESSTVKRWRRQKTGPQVVWLNSQTPRYRQSDVDQWLAARVA